MHTRREITISNTKRKVFVSGRWWYPIRRMAIEIDAPIEDVEDAIREMGSKPRWRRDTFVDMPEKVKTAIVPFHVDRRRRNTVVVVINGNL